MNLGRALRDAAALLAKGGSPSAFSGPYTLRFGASSDQDGVTGEPANGSGGYTRPSIATSNIDATSNVVTVTASVSVGPFTANLGTMNAVALVDSAGKVVAHGLLSQAVTFANGGPAITVPAGGIVLTIT